MIKGNFDYKNFAESMKNQAKDQIPENFIKKEAKFLTDTIYNFVLLSGEALNNDDVFVITEEEAILVCQLIADWTFIKIKDLVHLHIKRKAWDAVMQKIAFVIFEVAKQAIKKEIPQEEIICLVEKHVEKAWKECIKGIRNMDDNANNNEDNEFDYSDTDAELSTYYREKAIQLEEVYKIQYIHKRKFNFSFKLTNFWLNIKKSLNSFL